MNPEEQPTVEPVEHTTDDADELASRPIGTHSFVYGAKTLAASVVALLLMLLVDDVFAAAFWVLLAAGLLGVMFRVIECSTTGGAEVVSHRRVTSPHGGAGGVRPGDRGRVAAMKITVGSVEAT